MTTSLTRVMNAIAETKIAKYWISHFREDFRGEINNALIEAYKASGLTKADIARKLDRRPEQITRWLSAPSNLESDTISDIALSLGLIPKIRFENIQDQRTNNRTHSFASVYEHRPAEPQSTSSRTVIFDGKIYKSDEYPNRMSTTAEKRTYTPPVPNRAGLRKLPENA